MRLLLIIGLIACNGSPVAEQTEPGVNDASIETPAIAEQTEPAVAEAVKSPSTPTEQAPDEASAETESTAVTPEAEASPALSPEPVQADTSDGPDAPSTEQPTPPDPVDAETVVTAPDDPQEAAPEIPRETVRTWTLDPSRSFVAVLVRYDRNAVMAGHDHAVQATRFEGKVTWDPNDASACAIRVDVPVTHLQVDPGNSRSRMSLEGTTKDKDKASIRKNFLGKSQLWGDQHSSITFKATTCEIRGDQVFVTGSLSLRGVSKKITAPMRISTAQDKFSASGSFTIKHTDFGFNPFTAVLGALRNEDKLSFTLRFEGK